MLKTDDKNCFIWSILANLHPIEDSKNGPSTRVSNFKKYFDDFNIEVFDFSIRFKCSDVKRFYELNNLSFNIFELNFHIDNEIWGHNVIPIEISKNISDRVVDLLI